MAEAAERVLAQQTEGNRIRAEELARKRLEQHARRINSCDGSVREQLRDWLEAVSEAKRWTGCGDPLILEMVGYLASGALRSGIGDYVEGLGLEGATWDGVRDHVTRTFLDEDEAELQRGSVDRLKQAPYQDSREYGLKFSTAVQKAYTAAQLEVPLVMERLVKLFINGLRDREVRTQVHLARPADLEAAINRANSVARAVSLAETERRSEEPMEVGALPIGAQKEDEFMSLLKELTGSLRGLQKQLGRVEKKVDGPGTGPPPDARGRNNGQRGPRKKFGKPRFEKDGTPNCYNCGESGHFARNCSKQQAAVAGNA